MRVFLDTNVLASAMATRGLCADVVREILLRHTLVVSDEVEEELLRTLTRKFRVPPGDAKDGISGLFEDAERASSVPVVEVRGLDAADRAIVSAAVNGNADLLVSGDKRVRAVGRLGSMEVVGPREFWERLRSGPGAPPG